MAALDADSSDRRPGRRSAPAKILNALLWFALCGLVGTGFLLAFRLPPGSRGGAGLQALGMGRHAWGDIHTWISHAFVVLALAHLALHWRWLWQVASRRKAWALVAGIGIGIAVMVGLAALPVTKGGRGHGQEARGR